MKSKHIRDIRYTDKKMVISLIISILIQSITMELKGGIGYV